MEGIRLAALDFRPRMDVVSPFSARVPTEVEIARIGAMSRKAPAPGGAYRETAKELRDKALRGAQAQRKAPVAETRQQMRERVREQQRQGAIDAAKRRRSTLDRDWPALVAAVLNRNEWTKAELGRRVGCNRNHICDIVAGRYVPGRDLGAKLDALPR